MAGIQVDPRIALMATNNISSGVDYSGAASTIASAIKSKRIEDKNQERYDEQKTLEQERYDAAEPIREANKAKAKNEYVKQLDEGIKLDARSMGGFSNGLTPLIEKGDIEGIGKAINERYEKYTNDPNIDSQGTENLKELYDSGNTEELLSTLKNLSDSSNLIAEGEAMKDYKHIETVYDRKTKEPFELYRNPNDINAPDILTDKTNTRYSPDSVDYMIQSEFSKENEADKQIRVAGNEEKIAQRANRTKTINAKNQEFSEISSLNNAQKSKMAEVESILNRGEFQGGVPQWAKQKLSQLFGKGDWSDASVVYSALNSLAMDELQKFKGPTTDFEFTRSEKTFGGEFDTRESLEAKLRAQDRGIWAQGQKDIAFQEFIKDDNNNPNSFRYDILGGEAGKQPFKFSGNKSFKNAKGNEMTVNEIYMGAVKNDMKVEDFVKELNKARIQ